VTSAAARAPGPEARFFAMGCAVHVVVVGGRHGLVETAEPQIAHLEALWSRFRSDSDIARCNQAGARPTIVSPLTISLVRLALEGWLATGGRFDPTVLTALETMGYDRSFEEVVSSVHPPGAAGPAPGCGGITVDAEAATVTLPPGVRFDPGGIGKGLAADLVAAALIDDGADGACVNLGGDLRALGEAPTAGGWAVGLEDPYDPSRELARARFATVGVATTSRTYRSWERAGAQVHHVIDPTTGLSAWTDVASVTVVADTAWWAEVLAKAAFVAGPLEGAALIARSGASGVLVDDGGFAHPLPGPRWEVADQCWR
jgi:thiamine biosynthesis lipoprotein